MRYPIGLYSNQGMNDHNECAFVENRNSKMLYNYYYLMQSYNSNIIMFTKTDIYDFGQDKYVFLEDYNDELNDKLNDLPLNESETLIWNNDEEVEEDEDDYSDDYNQMNEIDETNKTGLSLQRMTY